MLAYRRHWLPIMKGDFGPSPTGSLREKDSRLGYWIVQSSIPPRKRQKDISWLLVIFAEGAA